MSFVARASTETFRLNNKNNNQTQISMPQPRGPGAGARNGVAILYYEIEKICTDTKKCKKKVKT